jgi:universal stress protein A
VKTIHEKHDKIGREADRFGHLIDPSPAKSIEHRPASESMQSQADTKVHRRDPKVSFGRILVPTDLTDDSRQAMNYALYLTKLVAGELILLHFYDESRRHLNLIGVRWGISMLEDESRQREKLYALRDEIRTAHPNTSCYFYIGQPAEEIPKVAREMAVDLTVISSHHLHGSSRWFLGGDAARIISHTICPVLVV